ncbi:MAG TPA: GspMb/PilO family protein [Gemmatimonadaceae bacterium]|nr:GspMb/PilO family protein [Gemmatimonadaceae bacterium]
MIELSLSARDRRTLTIGATAIGSLFSIGRGLPAGLQWERDQLAEAATLSQQVAVTRSRIRALSTLRDTLRVRQSRLDALDSLLIAGASAAAAASDLASALSDLAEAAPIRVTALQLRADSAAPASLTHVSVRVTGVTDVAGLAGFLRAVEDGDSPMSISELSVTQSEPGAPSNKVEALRVDVVVDGIARIRKDKSS